MKRRLETATEAPTDLQLESWAGVESIPKLLNAPDLLGAPELASTNDAGLLAPIEADVSFAEWDAARTQKARLRTLRLLWANRQLILYGPARCCATMLLAAAIPKQYVSAARLLPPESLSAAGGFGSIVGGLIGVSSSGSLLVALMRSRTVEDRMIESFKLKEVYRVGPQQDAYTRLQKKTNFSLEPKSGIVVVMARAYVEELVGLMAKLNNSSAHRERVFLEDRLQIVKVEMKAAENDFSEFSSKNGAMDITEQGRVMINGNVKLRGELIAEQSQLEEVRQIYSQESPRGRVLGARISELVNQQKQLVGTYSGKSFAEGETAGRAYPTLRRLPILDVPYETKFEKLKMEEAVLRDTAAGIGLVEDAGSRKSGSGSSGCADGAGKQIISAAAFDRGYGDGMRRNF